MNKSRSLNGSDPAGRNATFHDENRVELNERPGMLGAYLSRGSQTGSYRPLGKLFAPVKSQRYRLKNLHHILRSPNNNRPRSLLGTHLSLSKSLIEIG
jgi:hypothetical protein